MWLSVQQFKQGSAFEVVEEEVSSPRDKLVNDEAA